MRKPGTVAIVLRTVDENVVEAAAGFEPAHNGFAVPVVAFPDHRVIPRFTS